MNITVNLNKKQVEYLEKILFEDGCIKENSGGNRSDAIKWCIDACMKCEETYGIDALYVACNDVRLPENEIK